MRNKPSFAHPSTWFCLLGSALALGGFFLPFLGDKQLSLWAGLLNLLNSWQSSDGEALIAVELRILLPWVLLLLLLVIGMLACLIICFRPLKWDFLGLYRICYGIVLFGYGLAAALFCLEIGQALLSDGLPMASQVASAVFTTIIIQLKVGAWLMLAGVILAFRGGQIMDRKDQKRISQG